MGTNFSLGDEGMEAIRASESYRDLTQNEASALEEYLYTAFWGGDAVHTDLLRRRLDDYLDQAIADPAQIRRVILDAIESC
jgi:hypothetical protein